ncbi:VOC family protein [Mesobacillus maritimus]|uniref:VOC family protein n=1 Tax=Mesobacillus maritimus TaxID=1643336 RepID=UPI00203BA332|nr:VOC family protein [Mesobacillus maritimus]MCM3588813.1 VOC family protein [Mesobacillus maritimus]MCM3670681.1 VOC family protein [Mesobacillus maritimus]
MNLTHTRLLVEDYQECYRFYKFLGFHCTWGDETSNYAQFQVGNTLLAIFDKNQMLDDLNEKKDETAKKPLNEVVLIFAVEDVDEIYESLKSKVSFLTKPHDRKDWGIRVAHFRDPNGTLIEINKNITNW